jgi:leucyl/phenylalanyl-tRNA--protein transferase
LPVFRIPRQLVFPDPELAAPSGLLGVGGDVAPERLLLAYQSGIFPWYSDPPPLWFSPPWRMVLEVGELKVPKSTRQHARRGTYRVTMDTAFAQVLDGCAGVERPGQPGTWLNEDLKAGMIELHRRGVAHSVEAWDGPSLVGGLYGLAIGRVFCGESMFARAPDASKVAFVRLVQQLAAWGFPLVDCQVYTEHLARFGAVEIPRREFLARLAELRDGGRPGGWAFDDQK